MFYILFSGKISIVKKLVELLCKSLIFKLNLFINSLLIPGITVL